MKKEYIEKILCQNVQILPYKNIEGLPLIIKNSYVLNQMLIGTQIILLAAPIEKISLVTLRKQYHQLSVYTGLSCALYMKEMNYYTRDVLLKEGIPFVWEGHQIYMPFIGVLLNDYQRHPIRTCTQISFLTQKMLLSALYQNWQSITVTQASKILEVSKMSITRCFDELEALDVQYLSVNNRSRKISADNDKKAMWQNIRPILRNPVIKSYALSQIPDISLPLSGQMALSHYSMLDEEDYPVYAITKKDVKNINLSNDQLALAGETPRCVIQKLGYWICYGDGKAVDPLTVALSISEEEKTDPRISLAIDEMLEENVW